MRNEQNLYPVSNPPIRWPVSCRMICKAKEPGKPEEEHGEKALVFGKRIADARAEPHAENEREDHPRLNG